MTRPIMHPSDVARYHAAARAIEDDLHEAYFSTRERCGPEIAGALLVARLREQFNDKGQWPPPNYLIEKVNDFLREKGLMLDEA